ncbi:hypothetical protein GWI33_016978 [Rhynchophorus ferrugineus]|uniref:Uncharacterized protein n=1 Tax=Rhynchophorus ferrugineus TaxID=354439 RepID=A0A834I2R8_RHYFE|nr:hypothetical protein GWI33_016978 [Rhynchophorus ferrugineus]
MLLDIVFVSHSGELTYAHGRFSYGLDRSCVISHHLEVLIVLLHEYLVIFQGRLGDTTRLLCCLRDEDADL